MTRDEGGWVGNSAYGESCGEWNSLNCRCNVRFSGECLESERADKLNIGNDMNKVKRFAGFNARREAKSGLPTILVG